ncbi:universal stress protein [Halohasta litorea]|uniref:Universal stress protein n=1 Tax=Halohasta litorea TaxID=869891 RepID=A0ABD6DFP6_9EURY|nr:universal stress protein [Halohasta litorea]
MDRALVVVNSGDAEQVLGKRAGEFATALDADLHVVKFADQSEYQRQLEKSAANSRNFDSMEDVKAHAREQAQRYADKVFGDLDVEVAGVVDNLPNGIVSYAEEHNCDHIFVTGRKRSPSGKVLFGDTAQSIILNFEGPVTVITV